MDRVDKQIEIQEHRNEGHTIGYRKALATSPAGDIYDMVCSCGRVWPGDDRTENANG